MADLKKSAGTIQESGAQLITRLTSRPLLDGLGVPFLESAVEEATGKPIASSLSPGRVVEVCGEEGAAKTEFLYHCVVQCIMPSCWGGRQLSGRERSAIWIDTDFAFSLLRLVTVLEKRLEQASFSASYTNTDTSDVGDTADPINDLAAGKSPPAKRSATLMEREDDGQDRTRVSLPGHQAYHAAPGPDPAAHPTGTTGNMARPCGSGTAWHSTCSDREIASYFESQPRCVVPRSNNGDGSAGGDNVTRTCTVSSGDCTLHDYCCDDVGTALSDDTSGPPPSHSPYTSHSCVHNNTGGISSSALSTNLSSCANNPVSATGATGSASAPHSMTLRPEQRTSGSNSAAGQSCGAKSAGATPGCDLSLEEREDFVSSCLTRLFILRCESSRQLNGTLSHGVRELLSDVGDIGLLVIDSVAAFYWQDGSSYGVDSSQQALASRVRALADDYRLLVLASKPLLLYGNKYASESWLARKKSSSNIVEFMSKAWQRVVDERFVLESLSPSVVTTNTTAGNVPSSLRKETSVNADDVQSTFSARRVVNTTATAPSYRFTVGTGGLRFG